jgi:hypothetical protein
MNRHHTVSHLSVAASLTLSFANQLDKVQKENTMIVEIALSATVQSNVTWVGGDGSPIA